MTISRRQFVGGVAGTGLASVAAPRLSSAQADRSAFGLLAAETGHWRPVASTWSWGS